MSTQNQSQKVFVVMNQFIPPIQAELMQKCENQSLVICEVVYEDGEYNEYGDCRTWDVHLPLGTHWIKNDMIFESRDEALKLYKYTNLYEKFNQKSLELGEKIKELEKQVEISKEELKKNKEDKGYALPKFKPNDKVYFFDPKYVEKQAYKYNYSLDTHESSYHLYTFDNYKFKGVFLNKNSVQYRFSKCKDNLGDIEEYKDFDEKYCFIDYKERDKAILEFVKNAEIKKQEMQNQEIESIKNEMEKLQTKLNKLQ